MLLGLHASRALRACRPKMRMPSRRRSSFSRTMAATAARVGARNANTSSRLNAAAASTAPASKLVSGQGKGLTCHGPGAPMRVMNSSLKACVDIL